MKIIRCIVISIALVLFGAYTSSVGAYELDGFISLAEIYTSNVDLAPDGMESEEWVTAVVPRIGFQQITERYELDLDYTLEAYFYSRESSRNQIYNQADGLGFLNLLGEQLRLRGEGQFTQVNLDPDRPSSRSNLNTTGNRSDALRFEGGPEIEFTVLGGLDLAGYYYAGVVDYDDPETQDVDTQEGRISLGSFNQEAASFGYQLVYRIQNYEYELSDEVERQEAFAEAGYYLNPDLRLTGLVGKESDLADSADPSLDETRWEVGLQASLGDDRVDVSVGDRYFGTTYKFRWTRTLPDRAYRLSYGEFPGTTESLRLGERPRNVGEETLEFPVSDIERPGTSDRNIRKRADGSARWINEKSDFTLQGYWEDREAIIENATLGQPVEAGEDTSFGASARIRWLPGLRTTVALTGSWRRREFEEETSPGLPVVKGDDDLYRVEFNVDFELGQRTTASAGAYYQTRTAGAGTTFEYDEFQAAIRITRLVF